jgi:hypothetical protein
MALKPTETSDLRSPSEALRVVLHRRRCFSTHGDNLHPPIVGPGLQVLLTLSDWFLLVAGCHD